MFQARTDSTSVTKVGGTITRTHIYALADSDGNVVDENFYLEGGLLYRAIVTQDTIGAVDIPTAFDLTLDDPDSNDIFRGNLANMDSANTLDTSFITPMALGRGIYNLNILNADSARKFDITLFTR